MGIEKFIAFANQLRKDIYDDYCNFEPDSVAQQHRAAEFTGALLRAIDSELIDLAKEAKDGCTQSKDIFNG